LIGFIPISALAAVVIVSSAGLINFALIKLTWQSTFKSRITMVITFISALLLPLEYAIYLGILTTLLIYLGESSHINLSYILEDQDGKFIELPMKTIKERDAQIVILNIEGDLYFAAVEDLQSQIQEILDTPVKVLILRFRRAHLLASTAIMALDQLIQSARKKDIKILFCGIQEEVLEPLEDAGLLDIIGEEHIFLADDLIFGSTQRALEEAKAIINHR
jgi:SulP family sulfate permease